MKLKRTLAFFDSRETGGEGPTLGAGRCGKEVVLIVSAAVVVEAEVFWFVAPAVTATDAAGVVVRPLTPGADVLPGVGHAVLVPG